MRTAQPSGRGCQGAQVFRPSRRPAVTRLTALVEAGPAWPAAGVGRALLCAGVIWGGRGARGGRWLPLLGGAGHSLGGSRRLRLRLGAAVHVLPSAPGCGERRGAGCRGAVRQATGCE